MGRSVVVGTRVPFLKRGLTLGNCTARVEGRPSLSRKMATIRAQGSAKTACLRNLSTSSISMTPLMTLTGSNYQSTWSVSPRYPTL